MKKITLYRSIDLCRKELTDLVNTVYYNKGTEIVGIIKKGKLMAKLVTPTLEDLRNFEKEGE